MVYNEPFFRLYENWFIIIQEEFGKKEAIRLFRKVMIKGLTAAYGKDFILGDTKEFARLVGDRDSKVGLRVSFPQIHQDKLTYRFHTDPFPNLKSIINHSVLDDIYINFKVNYILGNSWKYKNISHLWKGDAYTEFLIYKDGSYQ